MAACRYVADAPELSRSLTLEGLTILYHRPSGLTHILAPPAPEILAALGEAADDPPGLVRRIGAEFDIEAEDAEAAVRARLAELEAAGLVRRA